MTPLRTLLAFALVVTLAACDSGGVGTEDVTPPSATAAIASGSTVTVTYTEAINPASVAPSAFTIAPAAAIASASASGMQVSLALGASLSAGSYTVLFTGVRDLAGNAASGTVTFSVGGSGGGSGGTSDAIGAAYPNAGDSRLLFVNTTGNRFLFFNPVTGSTTNSQAIGNLESNDLPLDDVAAAANLFGDDETYFFSSDGDTFTNYERDSATFDSPESFEEEFEEDGYDLDSIGAAMEGDFFASNSIVLFNQNGTQWQLWQPTANAFSSVYSFPAGFGGGNAPISAVGAAVFIEENNEIYLFNRAGTEYTIWRGGSNFTAAFPIAQLGDIDF